jgi:Pyruvate/2-oxoacid:ferredoxin oxidoreductase gamma subunit
MVRGGLHVFADQDYESRIRGGHNFFRVRVKEEEVKAQNETLDILIALNKETVEIHRDELKDNGLIILDKEALKLVPGSEGVQVEKSQGSGSSSRRTFDTNDPAFLDIPLES